jgi:hypothetical protein
VTAWNGVLDTGSETSPDLKLDTITTETGAKSSGVIQNIANGQISFQEGNGVTQIPMDKVSAIDFSAVPPDASKAVVGSVHATFTRGGFITFDLLSWRPDGVVVMSPVFGKASFDPSAFSRLQFSASEPKS